MKKDREKTFLGGQLRRAIPRSPEELVMRVLIIFSLLFPTAVYTFHHSHLQCYLHCSMLVEHKFCTFMGF